MSSANVPVDLLNPGQVFACVGLMELGEVLCGPCTGEFRSDPGSTRARFFVDVEGSKNVVEEAIRFLANASVSTIAPRGRDLSTAKWDLPTIAREDPIFPFPVPDSPATLPTVLTDPQGRSIAVEHWGDDASVGRDNVKFWAGSGGYPGAKLAADAIALLGDMKSATPPHVLADPFAFSCPQSSSFRFDWRRDYVPIDVGFSPNKHGSMTMVGYPLVELLAAIGLQHARPKRLKTKLEYRFAIASMPLPTMFVRAVLGGGAPNFPSRIFRVQLGWPGKEGQARCIIDTKEELSHD